MNLSTYKSLVTSQFDAAFDMLEECIRVCPDAKWKGKVGKYAFWHVAYHALYCTDLYTARSAEKWKTHPKFHPGGAADVKGEYPTRVMTRAELPIYSLRHLQHHTGQLGAFLRRAKVATKWKKDGN